jgi:hypothetical protein
LEIGTRGEPRKFPGKIESWRLKIESPKKETELTQGPRRSAEFMEREAEGTPLLCSCNVMIQWELAGGSLQENTIPWELGTGGREQGLGQRKHREAGEDVE